MYSVSEEYKNLILADSTKHALNVYIDGTRVDDKYVLGLSITHILFENDEFCFGSTPAKSAELKIHKDALPDTYERVYIETGINSISEIIPVGYFNVDEISKDDNYTVTLTLIDDMNKFEFNYDGSELSYPATLLEVLQDICNTAGVELGSTSFLNSDKEISVYDNTVTARTYLGYIAEQAGGFAVIGRDGKLYIKTIGENKYLEITVADVNEMSVEEVNSLTVSKFSNYLYDGEIPLKYFSEYSWGEEFKVSRIAYEDGVQDFKTGDETSNTIWIDSNNMYIVSQEQINNIYNIWNNFNCYSFSGTSIVDPAFDIGDIITIDDKNIIYQGTIDYKGKFKAKIESDIQTKAKEETTATTVSETTKIRRVQSSIDQVEGKITQLVEEIADNSEKISQHEQTLDNITDTISSVETQVETIEKSVDTAVENIEAVQEIAENAQTSADTAQETANNVAEQITTTTTKLTEVEETVDGITQTVSSIEETVNDLEVGSRNLLLATATQDTSKGNYQNSATVTGLTFLGCEVFQTNIAWADIGFKLKRVIEDNELQAGDVLTYSIYTKTVNTLTVSGVNKTTVQNMNEMTLDTIMGNTEIESGSKKIICYTSPSTSGTSSRTLATFSDMSNTDWKRLVVTFAIDETMMNYLSSSDLATRFECTTDSSAGELQYWAAPQLEKGTLATYYAPAPEDTEEAIEITKTELNTTIEQTASSITSTVNEKLTLYATLDALSDMETKIIGEDILSILADYITSSDLDTTLSAYVTSSEMSSTISQTQSSIISSVNTTLEAYVTTTDLDDTMKSYSTTIEMNSAISQTSTTIMTEVNKKVGEDEIGTQIEQNYESVQIAWNNISDYIQFKNAQIQILDSNKTLLMSLDKTGQHFYESGTLVGDIGLIDYTIDSSTVPMIAFNLNITSGTTKGMAWGTQKDSTFYPIFYCSQTYADDYSEYGGEFVVNGTFNAQDITCSDLTCSNSLSATLIGATTVNTTTMKIYNSSYTTIISPNSVTIEGVSFISYSSSTFYFGNSSSVSGYTTAIRGNTVRLYAHTSGAVYLGSSGSTAVTSDETLKDMKEIDDKYIEFFNNIEPKSYVYKNNGHRTHLGFGARQVETSLISAGLTTEDFAGVLIDKDVTIRADEAETEEDVHYDELYSLRYEEFIALNTYMIKKLQETIKEQEERIKILENK